jgi:hypothetical protein
MRAKRAFNARRALCGRDDECAARPAGSPTVWVAGESGGRAFAEIPHTMNADRRARVATTSNWRETRLKGGWAEALRRAANGGRFIS